MPYGTLQTFDTLAVTQQTVTEFGEDRAFAAIDAYFEAHNAMMREQLNTLVEYSTDQLRRYGGVQDMSMDAADEYSRADAQKITAGVNVGFPLYMWQISLQWTRKYFQNATGKEFAAQAVGMATAHRRRVQAEVRKAVFNSVNNTTYEDVLVDNVVLPLRALVNADSQPIPVGPNGEIFDGATHTHYTARAGGSVVAAEVTALIETVREHYNQGEALLYINRAQEATIRGFTSNFTPYLDARIVGANNANQAVGRLAQNNLYNRAIGLFDSAEVWVKPWIPAGYYFAFINGAPKPLVFRERRPGLGNLLLVAADENYPLRAQTLESEFGCSVWNRTNGAVLYGGGTSYVVPTFTA